jgi:predicted DNA-binding transcriptional regulator AlpA
MKTRDLVMDETEGLQLVTLAELAARFGIGVDAMERTYLIEPEFPRPVRLTKMRREPRRYLLSEIVAYMNQRLAARDQEGGSGSPARV